MPEAYQDQNATKKPNQAKKKTRPYMLKGFKPGMERALRLTGLTTGAFHSVVRSSILSDVSSMNWQREQETLLDERFDRID